MWPLDGLGGEEPPDYNQGGAVKVETIPGSVTVEPSVLETIARLTTLGVPGVVDIVEREVDRLLGVPGRSVVVQVKDERVLVEVHIVAGPDQSLLQLGRKIQYEVTRAVRQMTGMPVEAVNVHIEDVVYPGSAEWTDREQQPDDVV
jgi:uncharacterized alkaline shock family protein YloU